MAVSDDFPGNVAFYRHGLVVRAVVGGDVIWEREVWERGIWWMAWMAPKYEKRLRRARAKAERVIEPFLPTDG
jgi:hypothetical protein